MSSGYKSEQKFNINGNNVPLTGFAGEVNNLSTYYKYFYLILKNKSNKNYYGRNLE